MFFLILLATLLFRSEGASVSDLKHAPFLSTPLSVRKVRYGQVW